MKKRNNLGKSSLAESKQFNSKAPENDEEVAVIVDMANGEEYYLFMIDTFNIGRNDYTVMVPYEPGSSGSKSADIVILRSKLAKNGDQLYFSITDKKELDSAFDEFYKRFERADR